MWLFVHRSALNDTEALKPLSAYCKVYIQRLLHIGLNTQGY